MINEGEYVILSKAAGEHMKIFKVVRGQHVIIDKNKCQLESLIGKPYGFFYELRNDKQFHLLPGYSDVSQSGSNGANGAVVLPVPEINKDNRNLFDSSQNQKISHEEIKKLKSSGEHAGTDIIDMLVENSASFSQKTEFSQEKYINKKKQKYLLVYRALKPSLRTLSRLFTHTMMKRKLLNIRLDTIAQTLTYGNLSAHKNVLLFETCRGLILSAVVERLSGHGRIVSLLPDGNEVAASESCEFMNFPPHFTQDLLYHFPLDKLPTIRTYISDLAAKIAQFKSNPVNNPNVIEKLSKKQALAERVAQMLDEKCFDSILLVSKYRPLPLLKHLIGFARNSCALVIYSQTYEPLLECHSFLKDSGHAVHVELADSWMREYQVLPERTHPKMMMDCSSGFLLTGYLVECNK